MNRLIMAAALAVGFAFASSTPALAAAKNYDCTKAGNANKAVCKGAKPAAPAAAKSAPAAKAAPAKAATTTTKSVTRTYDCTKAGNANKAQCKTSTSVATSVTKPAPAPAQPTMLQRVKNSMTGSKPAAAAAPAAKPAPARKTAAAPASVEDRNPSGAIAQCKDGTYSHSKQRTGACSRHGGVAKWL